MIDKILNKLKSKKRLVALVILLCLAFSFSYKLYINVGSSMSPTLADKTLLLVNRKCYVFYPPEEGDIVVCNFDNERLVKRVLAVGGQTIEIKLGHVYVDGIRKGCGRAVFRTVDERGRVVQELYVNSMKEIVPEGFVWVMGDNRPDSWFGLVRVSDIKGKVMMLG